MRVHLDPRRSPRSRLSAGVIAGTFLLATFAVPAMAVDDVTARRVAGNDRYATAAAIARDAFPDGTSRAVIASGETFADTAAAASLAVHIAGPVLLTTSSALPDATTIALESLGVDDVTLIGGAAAVSPAVEAELVAQGATVERVAGTDRYATAGAVAEEIGTDGVAGLGGLRTAIIGSGDAFGDILASGSLIAAGEGTGVFPVLLTRTSSLPESTANALDGLDIEQAILVGGSAAISSSVEAEIEAMTGSDAMRVGGTDRFRTAIRAAEFAIEELANPAVRIVLANGLKFPDGLTAGVLAARSDAVILTTDGVRLTNDTVNFLGEHTSTVAVITAVGGTSAVSDGELAEAETSAEPGQND